MLEDVVNAALEPHTRRYSYTAPFDCSLFSSRRHPNQKTKKPYSLRNTKRRGSVSISVLVRSLFVPVPFVTRAEGMQHASSTARTLKRYGDVCEVLQLQQKSKGGSRQPFNWRL